jgi:hypothetical protein
MQATPDQAVAEFARNHGETNPDQEWLCHDWDVWVKNPHYTGKPGPHPEDDDQYEYGPWPVHENTSDIPF